MEIRFTVMGEPQGKGRPRFSKVGGFVKPRTPDETVLYENLIALECEDCGETILKIDNDGDANGEYPYEKPGEEGKAV